MLWKNHFAGRTALVRTSTVRDFLKYAGQPGIISFAGGLPDANLLPVREIQDATERVFQRNGSRALQYGETQGLAELRQRIADEFGTVSTRAENVLITTGSQQALDLIGRVLLDERSTVAVQNPTYLSALAAWRPIGASFTPLSSKHSGNCPEDRDLIYIIPNFQNPTGSCLSREERLSLVRTASDQNIPLLEDDPYRELRYDGEPLPSLFELASGPAGPVISVGSFSKILAPGLRLGWVIASTELVEELVRAKQALDLHTSSLSQFIAMEILESRTLDELIPKLRVEYRKKRDALTDALGPLGQRGVHWTTPDGGMFLFLHLPSDVNARRLCQAALNEGVLVVPGDDFHVDGTGRNTLRLNFTSPSIPEIANGSARLSAAYATVLRSGSPSDVE